MKLLGCIPEVDLILSQGKKKNVGKTKISSMYY